MIEAQLLSKVIDENSFFVLNKHNITQNDFKAYPHVYEYLKSYVKEFGQAPDYRNIVAKFEDFDYFPEVADTFPYLAKRIKSATAKRKAVDILQVNANVNYNKMDGIEFANWLYEEAANLKLVAEASSGSGTNFATNGRERKDWYMESKEEENVQYIPTPYHSLTKWLAGGLPIGDGTLIMAYTNRGKSWCSSDFARYAHEHGFGVLYYSPELTKRQQAFRFDTLKKHFNNVDLRRGELANEQEYFEYLEQFNEDQEVPFIIKTMEDLNNGLSTDVIESDLQSIEGISLVVIDGFNLMNHGKGGREGMTNTSRKLRQIWGKYGVAGLVVHQTPTSAEKNQKEDDIETMVEPPELTDYSETISVIQDNSSILTFNQKDGIGKMKIVKAREPNVGKVLDLRCRFNEGYITEASPVDLF